MTESPAQFGRLKFQMFALSFTALFLEMMVIRWVPSVMHLVAYYANLMLLSSFLGLGAGAMASGRKWNFFAWFPVFLAADIGVLFLERNAVLGTSSSEAHFYALPPIMFSALELVGVFGFNALLFFPLGQRMGALFNAMPRLVAYSWDLAGSLTGTLCFGLFSLEHFSPVMGFAFVAVVYLAISRGRGWFLSVAVFAVVLLGIVWKSDPNAIWSAYYYITVNRIETPMVSESAPPENLRTMRDPPIYGVKVNQFGYHFDASTEMARYTAGTAREKEVRWLNHEYGIPYLLAGGRERILVVGAGGGLDVGAALASGARHVDAVEIDPAIIGVSRRFSAGAPYENPRVSVHIDDARSFVAKADPGYDLVVYGFLDSQALFSNMNNVRLDGYVYTVEGIRSAYRLLSDNGLLALSFFINRPWLGVKVYQLVAEATGRTPTLYVDENGNSIIVCVPKDPAVVLPDHAAQFRKSAYANPPKFDLPTDDWPFLYLIRRTIPSDYMIAIGSLLAFSVAAVAYLRRGSFGRDDVHFGLLGAGFLLLETKSISDSTLFFGATWFVTMIVVTGVLLMVIGANFAAERIRAFSLWMYAPLFVVLGLLLVVPREDILGYSFTIRLLWTIFMVPLPVFFAGIIFSTTFRDSPTPSAAFGANLIGAMIGGFCEYLAMAIGNHRLSMLVIVAYLGSLLVIASAKRRGAVI
jgi:Spermine/spermidine synthase domain